MDIIIGIGEYKISKNPYDVLKTFALASCVAVTFYCYTKKISGMIHVALPSHDGIEGNADKPGYYATLGIPLIIEKLIKEYGCFKNELSVQLFGGANSIRDNDYFNIGSKNVKSIKNILYEYGISVEKSQVGGFVSRTIEMDVSSGNVNVSTQPIKI